MSTLLRLERNHDIDRVGGQSLRRKSNDVRVRVDDRKKDLLGFAAQGGNSLNLTAGYLAEVFCGVKDADNPRRRQVADTK